MPSQHGATQTLQVTYVAEMSAAPILLGLLSPAAQAAREAAGAQGSAYRGKTLTFTLSTTQP